MKSSESGMEVNEEPREGIQEVNEVLREWYD